MVSKKRIVFFQATIKNLKTFKFHRYKKKAESDSETEEGTRQCLAVAWWTDSAINQDI